MRISFPFNANVVLWIAQVLLALFIGLGSGLPKFILPADMLNMPIPLPDLFVKLIGTCEILGALGLILPGITRVRSGLTPLASTCLALLTVCATVYQLMARQPESAIFAIVLGVIFAAVAYGRWHVAPFRASRPSAALSQAAVALR